MKTILLVSVMLLNVVIAMAQTVSGTASNSGCQNSGIVTASSTGLTAPAQYQLLLGSTVVAPVSGDATQFTNNNVFQGLAPGTYTVKARGASGGTVYTSANIVVTDGFTSLVVTTPTKVNQCIGGTSALVTTVTGGQAPFVYRLSTSANPSTYLETSVSTSSRSYTFAALSTGSYLVSVTDNCGQTITAATSISDRTITVNDITNAANWVSRTDCNVDITVLTQFRRASGTLSTADLAYFTYKYKYQGQLYGQDITGDGYPDVGGAGFPLSAGTDVVRKLPINATAAGVLADLANMKVVVDDGCGNTKELQITKLPSTLSVRNCGGSGLINYTIRGLVCYPVTVTFTNASNPSDVYTTSLTTLDGAFNAPLTPGATYNLTYVDGSGATTGYFNTTTYTLPATSSFAPAYWVSAASNTNLGYGTMGISISPFKTTDQLTYTVLASPSPLVPVGYSNTVTVSALAGQPTTGLVYLPKPNAAIPDEGLPIWPRGTYTLAITSPCGSATLANYVVQGLAFTVTGNTTTPICGGFNYVLNGTFDNTNYEVVVSSGPSNVGTVRALASTSASLPFNGLGYGTYVFGVRVKGATTILASQTVTYGAANVIVVDAANTGGYVCTAGATDGVLSISAVSNSPAPGNVLQYALSTDGGNTYGPYQSSNVFTGLSSGVYYYKIKDGCLNEITQTAQIGVAATPTASADGVATPATVCRKTSGTLQLDVSVTGAASYLWSGPGITAANQSLKNPTVNYTSLSVGANNYTCTIVLGAPCNTTTVAPLVITVNPAPALVITNPAAVCSPGTVNLTAAAVTAGSDAGLTYSYFTNAAATTSLASASAVAASGTYYIKATNSNGCTSVSAVTATINPAPSAGISYSGSPFCKVGTAAVTRVGTSGGTYSSDAGLIINASTGLIDLAASTAGGYIITYSFTNGTCSATTSATITVNALLASPTVSVTQPTCSVATGTITVTTPASGVTYSFDNGATYQVSNVKSGLAAIATYQVVVKNNTSGCLSTSAPALMNAQPVPPVANATSLTVTDATGFGVGDFTLANATTTVQASNTSTVTTTYYATQVQADAGTPVLSSPFSATTGTIVFARVDAPGGCYATAPVTLVVTPMVGITMLQNVTITNPPISGTATALASVTVSGPNGQTCTTTADAAGAWTCTSLTFTVGSQTVTAIASNTAGVSNTATTNFTVVAGCPNPTVGGTVTYLGGPLCSASNVGSLTLTGQTGTVVKWQTSTNGGANWTDISGTFGKNYYNFVNAANGQQYRAVLNNGGACADAFSSPVTITTSPTNCSSATCDKSSGTVTFNVTPTSTGSNYSHVIIMTDGNGTIQYASAPGSNTLTNVATGNYLVYLVSYDNTQTPLPTLTVGTNLTGVGGACVVYSAQLPIKVCPLPPAFVFGCANATSSGAFLANGTAGQTGTLNLPITVTSPGAVTLLVSGTGFLSNPAPYTTTLTTGQTSITVPITYDGSGSAGTRTLTVTSANATGTCSPTVVVSVVTVPCTPVQPGIASASAASIQTGQVASFSLSQYSPASAAVTWTIVPSAGVSQASGTGTNTGNITFLVAGNYSIIYNIVNSSVPVGCNLGANSFATARLVVTSPPTLCQTPSPGIATVAPSSAAIPVNGTASVGLTGGTPNTNVSWVVIPSAGVSLAAGVGANTGTLTFTAPGLYQVVYTIYNAGDGTCLPVQNTAEAIISVGLNPCFPPSPITIVSSATSNTSLTGNAVTFTAVGGFSGAMSWTVTPGAGASPSTGTGNIATVNFSQTGGYVITFVSSNSSTPVGCTAPTVVSSSSSHSVVAPKLPPVATPDIANTNINTPVSGNVLTNDTDPQGGPLTASLLSQPTVGTVVFNPDGSYTYTPPTGFTGVASFCYSATNTAGLSSSACVTINVNPLPSPTVNNAPVANNDATQTTAGTPVTIAVLANDTDPDSATSLNGQLANPTLISQPSVGTAVVNANGTVTYTPPANFTGVVSFPYQVCDKATPALCTTALVTVNVQPTPPANTTLAPVAVDDALITQKDTPKTGTVASNDSDPQGLPLNYTTGQPTSGTVVMSPTGSYTYTPAPGYTGPASFTYSVCNSAGKCDVATVSVLVVNSCTLPALTFLDVNGFDPITCGGSDGYILLTSLPLSANLTINYQKNGLAQTYSGTSDANGTLTIPNLGTGIYGQFSYQTTSCASSPYTGTVSIGTGPSLPALTVNKLSKTNPTVCGSATGSILVSGLTASQSYTISYSKNGGATQTVAAVANASGQITLSNLTAGTYSGFTYQQNAGCISKPSTVTLVLSDPAAPTLAANQVTGTNPTSCGTSTGSISLSGLTPSTSYTVVYSKNGGAAQTVVLTSDASGTVLLANLGQGSYQLLNLGTSNCTSALSLPATVLTDPAGPTLAQNQLSGTNPTSCGTSTGSVNISGLTPSTPYTVVYSKNGGAAQTVVLTSNASGVASLTGLSQGSYTITNVGVNSCTAVQSLSAVVLSDPAAPVLTAAMLVPNNPATCGSATGSFSVTGLTPSTSYTLSYQKDGGAVQTVSLTSNASGVLSLTGLGVGSYSNFVLTNGLGCASTSLAGPFNLSNPTLPTPTVSTLRGFDASCAGNDGRLVLDNLAAGQTFVFHYQLGNVSKAIVATANASGVLSVTGLAPGVYSDFFITQGACRSGTYPGPISLTAVCLPPVVTPDIANTKINTPVSGNVLTNDTDPQGDGLIASLISQPTNGTVVFNSDGSYTYTPPTGFTGVTSFCYLATNSVGQSSSACVTINVVPDPSPSGNNSPVANNDATQTTAGTPVTIAVLANDTDPDSATSLNGQLANPTLISQPSVGTAVVNANGTVTYTPPANFTGVVSFPYQVCDKATPALCTTALVTVNVQPTPPANTTLAPVAVDDALITQKDTPKTGTVASNDSDPQGLPLNYTTGQPTSGTVVMSPTGSYTYTPAPGYTGPASFTYSVCNSAGKCDVATVSVLVQAPGGLILLPKVWLQGALFGVTDPAGIMRDDLRSKGYLPLSSPYTSFSALTPTPALSSSAVFATTGNNAIVDWVFVELRSPSSSSTVIDSRAALLQRDGDIVELDGVSPMVFSKASAGNYYVAVRHRNHLGVMTASAIPISATGTVVDFRIPDPTLYYRATTSAINQAQVTVAQGVAMWAGNVLYDKTVIYQSTNNDVAAISVQVKTARKPDGTLFNPTGSALYTLKGYYTGDVNLDGNTIYQGTGNDVNYIFLNVTKNHKGNLTGSNIFIIREQLP